MRIIDHGIESIVAGVIVSDLVFRQSVAHWCKYLKRFLMFEPNLQHNYHHEIFKLAVPEAGKKGRGRGRGEIE